MTHQHNRMPTLVKVFNKLAALPCQDIAIIIMGAMLINVFFALLADNYFSTLGFSAALLNIVNHSNSPEWWKVILTDMAQNSSFFASLFEIVLPVLSIFSILLLWRSITTLMTSILFFFVWMSVWNYPGAWIFEFLFPTLIGLCAGLASLSQCLMSRSLKQHMLGYQIFGSLAMKWRITIAGLASSILWYFIILSKNGGIANAKIAWQSALTFGILFLITAFIDRIRVTSHSMINSVENKALKDFRFILATRLQNIPWLDLMVMTIGAMLVIQVYADIAVNWFTVEGYQNISQYFAHASNAPFWFKDFLFWSSKHASILMPIQFVFESAAAICLTLLIVRGPMLVLTTGLLFILMFTEFGVSASWPVLPDSPRTWTWELLFITSVAFFLSLKMFSEWLQLKSLREKILGNSLYGKLSVSWQLLIGITAVLSLWSSGSATHVFGEGYKITSWRASITYAALFVFLFCIDRFRTSTSVQTTCPS